MATYPTTDELFRQEQQNRTLNGTRGVSVSYGRGTEEEPASRSIQSAGRSVQSAGRGMQATGTSMRVAGNTMRVAGKAADTAGKGMIRGGAALSSTGLGAIVGVPLIALGGITSAGGKASSIAGKQINRSGKRINRAGARAVKKGGQLKRAGEVRGYVARYAKAGRATIVVISVGLGTFYLLQLFLGLAYLISFGILAGIDNSYTQDSETGGFLVSVGNFFVGLGRDLFLAIADAFDFDVGGIFIVCFALCLLWGFITLLSLSFIYAVQGIKPLGGRGVGSKNGLFLLTLVSFVLPILNMLPVFIIWAVAVFKNPK